MGTQRDEGRYLFTVERLPFQTISQNVENALERRWHSRDCGICPEKNPVSLTGPHILYHRGNST
jgi:hypothetical protein